MTFWDNTCIVIVSTKSLSVNMAGLTCLGLALVVGVLHVFLRDSARSSLWSGFITFRPENQKPASTPTLEYSLFSDFFCVNNFVVQ